MEHAQSTDQTKYVQDGIAMEEAARSVPICDGDNESAMKTCGQDDQEETRGYVTLTSYEWPSCTVDEVEAGIVNIDIIVDTCKINGRCVN